MAQRRMLTKKTRFSSYLAEQNEIEESPQASLLQNTVSALDPMPESRQLDGHQRNLTVQMTVEQQSTISDRDAWSKEEDLHIRQSHRVLPIAEESVLGFQMTPSLMNYFKERLETRFRAAPKTAANRFPIVFEPTWCRLANETLLEGLRDLIKESSKIYSCDLVYRNQQGMELRIPRRLKFRLDLCDLCIIRPNDPRTGLRGSNGLKASTFIPPYTVLGAYRGLILAKQGLFCRMKIDSLFRKELHLLLKEPRTDFEYSPEYWNNAIRRYLVEEDIRVTTTERKRQKLTIDFSAFGYYSPGALLNDPRIMSSSQEGTNNKERKQKAVGISSKDQDNQQRPVGSKSTKVQQETVGSPNVEVQAAYIADFPFVIVYTSNPVFKGEELLYDYGKNFKMLDEIRLPNGERLKAFDENKVLMDIGEDDH